MTMSRSQKVSSNCSSPCCPCDATCPPALTLCEMNAITDDDSVSVSRSAGLRCCDLLDAQDLEDGLFGWHSFAWIRRPDCVACRESRGHQSVSPPCALISLLIHTHTVNCACVELRSRHTLLSRYRDQGGRKSGNVAQSWAAAAPLGHARPRDASISEPLPSIQSGQARRTEVLAFQGSADAPKAGWLVPSGR